MKLTEIIKETWEIFPFSFLITLLARLLIVGATLSYLDSIDSSNFTISLILNLWALTPLYYSIRNFHYELLGCQTPQTLLWNRLSYSIHGLAKASKKRINATKQRIWIERNPEINIYNYWFLKYLRKKEWMNIDIEKEKKENSQSKQKESKK